MPIETQCTGCGRTLRVADEHAGKQARCPVCQTIYIVPQSSPYAAPTEASASPLLGAGAPPEPPRDAWYMQTATGQVYGPVSKPGLDKWVEEGRVDGSCRLRPGPEGVWIAADEIYSSLTPRRSTSATPWADNPFSEKYSPAPTGIAVNSYALPHRGVAVLILGVLTWFVQCPLFGLAAWLMGSRDLGEMRAGRMDNSGEGLTQVGRILGMLHVLLFAGIMALIFIFAMLGIIANAM